MQEPVVTVAATPYKIVFTYPGSGSATQVPYTFKIFQAADLVVQKFDTNGALIATLALGTDYTLDGIQVSTGGNVYLTTALTTGQTLVAFRDPAAAQNTVLQEGGQYSAAAVMAALDLLTMEVQAVKDRSLRAPHVPGSESPVDSAFTLPSATNRANKTLFFDALGNPTTGAPPASGIISAAMQPVTAAATLAAARAAMGPWGDALVTASGSTTARSLSARAADLINVKDYGAKGDATTDDTAAIQAAITAASVAVSDVYIPAGTYKITAPLNIPITGGLRIFGSGKTVSILKASGTFASIFNIGTTGAQTIRGCFQDLQCNAMSATVQYGIYGSRVEEHDFERVACWGFTVAGFSIGFGYCNNYLNAEASYNTGNGFEFNTDYAGGGNNANNFIGCLALANTGWGIKARSGYGLDILGCTIEQNQKGGILTNAMSGVRIKSYFEGNAITGITYTTPAVTVKADIVLNGSNTDTDMNASFPSQGVVIEACNTAPRNTSNAFVWNAGGIDISIRGCSTNSPGFVPVLAEHYNNAYKGQGVIIESCSSFTTQISEVGATAGINNTAAAILKIVCPLLNIEKRNYAVTDQNLWTAIVGGSAVTYRRSTTASLYRLKNADVWELASSASGSSQAFGFTLTATDYPDLVGKQVWFGMWVYCTDASCYALPYCDQQTFNSNPTALGVWTLLAVSFMWPASGTITLGAYKTGGNTGSVFLAAPMLARIGASHEDVIGLTPKYLQWQGTAAPVAGTWAVGNRVLNSVPTVGQPKAWSCTVAGSPGTWVSEGNL